MIVCTDCGHHNDDTDEFCGSCGAFLEWAGERVETPPPPPPPAEPEPAVEEEDARPGLVQRVKTAIADPRGDTEAEAGPNAVAGVAQEEVPDVTVESEARPEPPKPEPRADTAEPEAGAEAAGRDAGPEVAEREGGPEAAGGDAGPEVVDRGGGPEAAEREAESATAEPEAEPDGTAESDEKNAERARRAAALVAKPPPPAPSRATRRRSRAVSTPPPTEVPDAAPAPKATPDPDALGPQQPAAVQPAPPKARPQKKITTESKPTVRDGDFICGQCGTGNDAQRRFCRRCGASLAEAEVAKLSWWQRRKQRRKEPVAAGERRSRKAQAKAAAGKIRQTRGRYRRLAGKLMRVVGLLAVLGIAGLAIGPMRDTATDMGKQAWEKVSGVFPQGYAPVHAVGADASSSAEGHPPTHAIDTVENTYWAEGAEGTGEGQRLVLGFGESPVDIDRVVFFSGAAGEEFVKQPRPSQVRLVFSDGTTADVTLEDALEQQDHPVEARQVTAVEVQILSVHPGTEGSAAAINDVEFAVKR